MSTAYSSSTQNSYMKTTITTIAKILTSAALLSSIGLAQAVGSATADIGVSANINAKCTISASAVAFGEYDPVTGGAIAAEGSVDVACTKGSTGLSVGLGNGVNYAASTRNMNGGTSSDKLAYSLVQPTSNAAGAACPGSGGTAWTTASALTLTSPATKDVRTYKVCGQIAAGQDKSVDIYSDTVVATINF